MVPQILNSAQITENVCTAAIIGGNPEIVRICQQSKTQFDHCLRLSLDYHRYEIFEWLELNYDFLPTSLLYSLDKLNEPAFYYLVENGAILMSKEITKNHFFHMLLKKDLQVFLISYSKTNTLMLMHTI